MVGKLDYSSGWLVFIVVVAFMINRITEVRVEVIVVVIYSIGLMGRAIKYWYAGGIVIVVIIEVNWGGSLYYYVMLTFYSCYFELGQAGWLIRG